MFTKHLQQMIFNSLSCCRYEVTTESEPIDTTIELQNMMLKSVERLQWNIHS